jgi:hypothetical protein
VQLHAIDQHVAHSALIHIAHKLGEVDFFVLLSTATLLNHFPQQKGRQPYYQPESYGFDCRIHQETPN